MDIVGLKPTIHFDGGADGRVVVADSLTYFEGREWFDDIVVGASFAGAPTGAIPLRQGAKGWIAHEAGPGKDEAGIAGLPLSDRFKVPAAAVRTKEARLSGGQTLLTGHIARVNEAAHALGVSEGQTGDEAARLMLKAPRGHCRDLSGLIDEATHEIRTPAGTIYACWSFSRVTGRHPDDVFCVASHGAKIMAQYALNIGPKGLICNDAGGGYQDSGSEGVWVLDDQHIAAATVSTASARIGDALSTYHDGIISVANRTAQARGVSVGMTAQQACKLMLEN